MLLFSGTDVKELFRCCFFVLFQLWLVNYLFSFMEPSFIEFSSLAIYSCSCGCCYTCTTQSLGLFTYRVLDYPYDLVECGEILCISSYNLA